MADRKSTVKGLGISMPILAMIAVALRFHARRLKKTYIGADDYMNLAGMVFAVALCAVITLDAYIGNLGGHTEFSPDGELLFPAQYVAFSKILYAYTILFAFALGFTKLSVLLLYRRIFIQTSIRILTSLLGTLVIVWTIGFLFAGIFQCSPISTNWNVVSGEPPQCVNLRALTLSSTVSDIATDVIILVMPWYPVWQLQMPVQQKFGVCAIFLLGSFVVAASIVRSIFLVQSLPAFRADLADFDFQYSTAPAIYWAAIEACVGVVSGCLPLLRPVLGEFSVNSLRQSMRNGIFGPSTSRQDPAGDFVLMPAPESITRSIGSRSDFGKETVGTDTGLAYYERRENCAKSYEISQLERDIGTELA